MSNYDEEVKEDSPWTYPLIIIGITLLLSVGVFYYYFGPSLSDIRGDTPEASARTASIHMAIGGTNFVIPENHTQFPRARRGGPRDSVALYALFPTFEAYTVRNDHHFIENGPENPINYFQIEISRLPMSETERVDLIYRERLSDAPSEETDFGLTRHEFADGTAYEDQDLFLATSDDGQMIAFICTQLTNQVPSPNCRREMILPDGLVLSYRFKQHYLPQWQQIDTGLQRLVTNFRSPLN